MSEEKKERKKVVFCVPTYPVRPHQACLDALRDCIPAITAAGWEEGMVSEIGCPYISAARATMLRKALDAKATHVVFIDSDVSWRPEDMLKLLETEGDVVSGTYRFKNDEETYMGVLVDGPGGRPLVRADGCVKMQAIPAGFLKVTRHAVNLFMKEYPKLCYGEPCTPSVDLFNHGAFEGAWWGEDYAFSRNWLAIGGEIWVVPDMNIDHHVTDKAYKGNFHRFLLKQPGGSESANPISLEDALAAKGVRPDVANLLAGIKAA